MNTEFEDMRQQLNILKEKLQHQAIVNDQEYVSTETFKSGEFTQVAMVIRQPQTEEEDVVDNKNDLSVSMLVQLQNYLLGSKNYSPSLIKELDMNFDDVIDVYDFVLLRNTILDS